MYRTFFGLAERPFDLTPNPRFVVLTEAHREALSNMEYGIASRRGITLLIGEAGTGKTTLIRSALQRQPAVVRCVYLHNPALTRDEFIEMLAVRFQLSAEARTSKTTLLTELELALADRHRKGESSVLIVDEAQSLPIELLEEIRLLGNIETDETKLLSIVLAGQPELAARLNLHPFRQLKQRIALRCELKPLTQTETAAYLAGRIRAAGGVGAQIFSREAVVMMHEHSRGIPRTLSVIADNALLTAFALQQKPVTSHVVAEVCRDFQLNAAEEPLAEVPGGGSNLLTTEAKDTAVSPTTHADSAPRVLAFDHPLPEPVPAPRPKDVAASLPAQGESKDSAGLFNTMYPKRRRFSLFRTGSR
jgi:general secretion pathway protein A